MFDKAVLKIKFTSDAAKDLYDNGSLLGYATPGSSGFDLRALAVDYQGIKMDLKSGAFCLRPWQRCLVMTGVSCSFDQNYELQIRSRSGLALKHGIKVLNSPGTIDSDYRGELGVVLFNASDVEFQISWKDRIAQAVFCPVIKPKFDFVYDLDESERSEKGFGSSGVK